MELRRAILASALTAALVLGLTPIAGPSDAAANTAVVRVMTLNIFYGGDELDLQTGAGATGRPAAPRRSPRSRT